MVLAISVCDVLKPVALVLKRTSDVTADSVLATTSTAQLACAAEMEPTFVMPSFVVRYDYKFLIH